MTPSYRELNADLSTGPLPADGLYFRFSASMKWFMLFLTFASCGFLVFGIIGQLNDLNHFSLTLMVLYVALFGTLTGLCLQMLWGCTVTVAVNSDGIWGLPRSAAVTFIRWSDVGSVRALDVVQRLVVRDTTGNKKIKLEYQLENFEKLRAFVLEHSAAARLRTPPTTIFHRNWVNRGVMLASFVIFLLLTGLCVRQRQPRPAPIFLGFAVLALAGLMREPARVEITNDGIVIRYLGWRRTVPFDSITNIEFVDLHDRGNVRPTVIIERKSGKSLKLVGYREGSIALNDALSSAWRTSRGGQAPPPSPTPPSEPVQPSPSLLTTFHGDAGAAYAPAVGLAYFLAPGFVYWELSRIPRGSHNAASELMFAIPWAAIGIYFSLTVPKRLTIDNDSFTVEYYHRRRIVPFASIANIELIAFRNAKGTPVKLIKVTRDGGATLRLAGFKEDAPTLYASLRDAWQRSRGDRLAAAPEKRGRG